MSKQSEFKNHDKFIQIGINIGTVRRLRGLSQEQLAEKSHISRSFLSAIEAPKTVRPFSLEVLFNIAEALDVSPGDLIDASILNNVI